LRVFNYAPKFTAAANADLAVYKGSLGDVRLLADASYTGSFFFYANATGYIPGVYTPAGPFGLGGTAPPLASTTEAGALTLVNFSVRWEEFPLGPHHTWASLWVKNAFDAHELTGAINFGDAFGQLTTGQFNDPRTYGLAVGMKW
jgi:iron complex outermembrane receptor protein